MDGRIKFALLLSTLLFPMPAFAGVTDTKDGCAPGQVALHIGICYKVEELCQDGQVFRQLNESNYCYDASMKDVPLAQLPRRLDGCGLDYVPGHIEQVGASPGSINACVNFPQKTPPSPWDKLATALGFNKQTPQTTPTAGNWSIPTSTIIASAVAAMLGLVIIGLLSRRGKVASLPASESGAAQLGGRSTSPGQSEAKPNTISAYVSDKSQMAAPDKPRTTPPSGPMTATTNWSSPATKPNSAMAKGFGIAALVFAILAIPIPFGIIVSAVAIILASVGALAGDRIFATATALIALVNALVLSPSTWILMNSYDASARSFITTVIVVGGLLPFGAMLLNATGHIVLGRR